MRKDLVPKPGYPKLKRVGLDQFPIPCYVQVKYDGELTYVRKDEEGWFTINRWGRVRRDYSVTRLAEQLIERERMFVGELYVKGENLYSFLKKRGSGEELRLAVFDVRIDKSYRERYQVVEAIFPRSDGQKVHVAEGKLVQSRRGLEVFYQKTVERGFEGVVGRSPTNRFGQTALKKKKLKTADVVILGIVKDSKLFKQEDMVGSLLVGSVENGKYVPVGRVASGFTDEQRKALYEVLMPFKTEEDRDFIYVKPALVIEVSYQETVESRKYEVGFTMRSPVFRGFRRDKRPNKADCGLEHQFPNAQA